MSAEPESTTNAASDAQKASSDNALGSPSQPAHEDIAPVESTSEGE